MSLELLIMSLIKATHAEQTDASITHYEHIKPPILNNLILWHSNGSSWSFTVGLDQYFIDFTICQCLENSPLLYRLQHHTKLM